MKLTRKELAAQLWQRLQRGPGFAAAAGSSTMTPAEAQAAYKRWAQSWVLEDVRYLVPELKEVR